MKIQIMLLLALSLVLFSGSHAYAQTASVANHVVINEIETNPPGDDSKTISEWIELYNPTSETVDIGGWEIVPTVLTKTLVIPAGTEIKSEQFLTFSYRPIWFTDISDSVQLWNSNGTLVDKTPSVTDSDNDFSSWQRIYDAVGSDSDSDWTFETSSPGSTNGKLETQSESTKVSVSINSDKSQYVFGESAVLYGNVSEALFVEKPTFAPVQIIITISGPNYSDIITLYPNLDLEFSTSIGLQNVLGISEGIYNVTAQYGDTADTVQFSVGHQIVEATKKQSHTLHITTDEISYMPGDTVTIYASTTQEVPFEGLKFTVEDSAGDKIAQGTLFPSSDVTIPKEFGNSSGRVFFMTDLFVDTTSPAYGQYRILGQYSTQTAQHTFDVTADVKENTPVSLKTDKPAYEPGEIIVISGRSNDHWVPYLSLEILKSSNLALSTSGGTGLKILDNVKLEGDSTFSHEIAIPENFESFGEYRVTVSGKIGTFSTKFAIVEDSSNFVSPTDPFFVVTDKAVYEIGEVVRISGSIRNQIIASTFVTVPVEITITNTAGNSLASAGTSADENTRAGAPVDLRFTAIPDPAGNFMVDAEAIRSLFPEGAYAIHAKYGNLQDTTVFIVTDPINLGSSEIIVSIDKEIYGFGETLNLFGKFGAQTSDSQAVSLTLYKPDGDTDKFGTTIDGGFFSWSWDTPISETSSGSENDRAVSKSNIGVYRLNVEIGGNNANVFFKISKDPQNYSLDVSPLAVFTDRSLYQLGDTLIVRGNVLEKSQSSAGLIPDLVNIKVLSGVSPYGVIYEANVFPDNGGFYTSSFELPISVFLEGTYNVRASYSGETANAQFGVSSGFVLGTGADLELILTLDKEKYYPGDTLKLHGQPSKIVYVETFDVSIIKQSENSITCGAFYCGQHAGPVTSIQPDPTVSFTFDYKIPESNSLGSYEITVDAGFDTVSITFLVEDPPAPSRITDKVSRIVESNILIAPEPKFSEGHPLTPRAFSGSLLTVRGAESQVNLQITSTDGVCVIGQSDDCLISNSTRSSDAIYSVVSFGQADYKVRYSGPDVVFEKFAILPAANDGSLPLEPFAVSIIKDQQPSRFYYKITYVPLS